MRRRLSILAAGLLAPVMISLSLAAPAMAQTAQDQINNALCSGSNLQFSSTPGACSSSGQQATDQIDNIVHTVVNLLSAIVGIVAVIMIIVGGFRYITSGGNDTSVTAAKNTILYAIIGLVVVALAQVMVRFTLSKLTSQ